MREIVPLGYMTTEEAHIQIASKLFGHTYAMPIDLWVSSDGEMSLSRGGVELTTEQQEKDNEVFKAGFAYLYHGLVRGDIAAVAFDCTEGRLVGNLTQEFWHQGSSGDAVRTGMTEQDGKSLDIYVSRNDFEAWLPRVTQQEYVLSEYTVSLDSQEARALGIPQREGQTPANDDKASKPGPKPTKEDKALRENTYRTIQASARAALPGLCKHFGKDEVSANEMADHLIRHEKNFGLKEKAVRGILTGSYKPALTLGVVGMKEFPGK